MKIYTNTFDVSRPSPHRFWVPPYSDFKIGIKLVNAGVELENDFTVAAGTTELIADETKIDGFTIYTLNSTDTGFVEYTITVDGLLQKLKLVQIVSDSTVFDIDERGGDMSQYATKNWVESEISGFVDEAALSAKADNVKQLPADLTSWVTDGWYAYYEDPESGSQEQRDFTKLTTGFYDISQYCDYNVSAQYVYDWDGYYYTTRLFSYCTNGKTVFCH